MCSGGIRALGLLIFAFGFRAVHPARNASAQEVSGNLTGRVIDARSEALAEIRVEVEGRGPQNYRTVSTDSTGRFQLSGLPVGVYRVAISGVGYRPVVVTDVAVRLGRTSALGRIALEADPLQLEPIVIQGRQSLIDPASTEIGFDLEAGAFGALPTGREYLSIVQILPQSNESQLGDPVNIAGATGLENAVHIEGVNVTDVYRGRTATGLPYNFVKAIEVKQAGYGAEYGNALGGIVNVVTHSGGPTFEWRAVGFYSADGLSATPRPIPAVLARTSFSDFDLGLSASGPLPAERMTFFAAYNPQFSREDIMLPGLGLEEARVTKHMFSGKLEWRPSRAADVTLSVFGDPTTERRVSPAPGITLANADPILSSHREGGTNIALRGTARLGARLYLEGSIARHARSEDAEGATALGRQQPSFIDRRRLPTITLSGGNGTDEAIGSARVSARAAATLFLTAHTLKAGAEFQRNRLDVRNDENPGQIAWLAESLYRASVFIQDFTVRNRVLSAYLQDSWSVSDRVRLNFGIRWDGQYLIDQNGDLGQSITNQLQPRAGFTYQPGAQGRSKFFGHAGRFYQQLALFWSTIGLAGFDQRQVFSSVDPRTSPGQADSTLVLSDPGDIRGGTKDLQGEHHDEFVLGYEHQIGPRTVVGVKGIHRALKASITAAFTPDRRFVGGNPGRGDLAHLPPSERRYQALEVSLRHDGSELYLLAAYVLSRNRGNYPGLFVAEAGGLRGGSRGPNNNQLTYFPAQTVNADGPLPNDRPHVLKVATAWRAFRRLQVGAFFTAQSGVPLSQLGRVTGGFNAPLFLAPRGSEGRTPSNWDLSLRLAYDVPRIGGRVLLDLLHVGNPQSAAAVDQRRFNGARGSPFDPYETLVANQTGERPGFGTTTGFQPPFQLRLGFEAGVR